MTDLRNSVFLLITFLIVVFGISNIQSFEDDVLNFHPAFFIMLMLAAFGGILISSRISIYYYVLLWAIIYLFVWLFYFRYLSDPRTAQELGVQFLLIEISAGFSYFVGRQVQQIDVIVKGLLGSAYPNRTIELSAARDIINTEFTRSRRYKRPLTALIFELESFDKKTDLSGGDSIPRDLLRKFAFAKMGQIINEFARQTDLILSDRTNRFILVCPETNYQNSTAIVERICQAVNKNLDVSVTWGAASFPEDALTFDDLIERGIRRLISWKPISSVVDQDAPELG